MLMERSELGNCRLIRRIGAGAMGEVYLAEQVRLGNRLVAVKVVRADQDLPLSDGATAHVERHFVREAQLLGQLTHPNILPVYHSGIEAGYLFLVMQYAPDGSLADAIKGNGPHRLVLPASLPFVVDVVGQVADALQYTHEHGVIHADVKPANVLTQIEPNGHWHVLLADFGISQSRDTIASRNEVAGTASYMAPEQFYGHVSAACDQYALGVVTFQLLSGRTPFAGGFVELAQAHARENPPALRALNPAVPASVEAVIVRALAKQPADRYPSVAAFAEALRAAFLGASTMLDARTRGANAVLPVWPVAGASDVTLRSVPSATRAEPPVIVSPPRAQHAHSATAGTPVPTRRRGRAGRRAASGLAIFALLLLAAVAAIGLRAHIDISQASSSQGTNSSTGQIPATGAHASKIPTPSPTSPYFAPPPPPPGTSYPPSVPTPTPTSAAAPTQEPTPPQPTATVAPQPTPTASPEPPQPTATAAAPQPTATAAPQPTATAGPQPPQATPTPVTSQPPSTPTLPALPRPITGPP